MQKSTQSALAFGPPVAIRRSIYDRRNISPAPDHRVGVFHRGDPNENSTCSPQAAFAISSIKLGCTSTAAMAIASDILVLNLMAADAATVAEKAPSVIQNG